LIPGGLRVVQKDGKYLSVTAEAVHDDLKKLK
jgi:hypothetical protein